MLTSVIDRLDRATTGRIIRPTDTDYDDARRTFNALIDRRPAALIRCVNTADVAATIAAAQEAGLPLGVRGGGHSVAGHAIVEGGLVADLSQMRSVEIDVEGRVAHVSGGAQWLDLDPAALAHGLATTGGVYGDTGVAGLTLGGGVGFLQGMAGFSCDNLVGAQVVTANGTIIEAVDDPELLWALRGGGGNFGVVTRLDMALHPVGPTVCGKALVPLGEGDVLRRWSAQMLDAPDELLPMLVLLPSADGSSGVAGGPPGGAGGSSGAAGGSTAAAGGSSAIEVQFAYFGTEADGVRYAEDLLGEPVARHPGVRPGTYADVQAINPIESFGRRNYWTSTFVRDLDDELVDLLVDVGGSLPTPESGMLLEPVHGAARRMDPAHAAFQNRSARFHVSAIAVWEDPALDAACTAWSKAVTERVRAWSTGGLYANYSMPGEAATITVDDRAGADRAGADRARAAWPPDTYARLQAIKRRYDPTNVFRGNLNILPAAD